MANPKAKQVLLDFETEFSKDPTSPTPYLLKAVSNGIVGTDNTKTDNIIGGDIDSGGELYTTSTDVSGNITTPMYYEQIGVLLRAVLGKPETTAGTASGTFVHTFKSTECIKSVVVEDTLDAKCADTPMSLVKRFNGLMANTMQVNASPDGDYNIEVNFVGATARDSLSDGITALDTTNKKDLSATRIINKHARLHIDDDVNFYKLSKEFSFSIDRGTTAEKVLSAGAVVNDSQFLITGNLNSIFDKDMYLKAKNNSKVKTALVFESGDNKLEFIMEETQYSFKDEARSYGEQYALNCDFNAYKKDAAAKLVVKLTNKVASYE